MVREQLHHDLPVSRRSAAAATSRPIAASGHALKSQPLLPDGPSRSHVELLLLGYFIQIAL